MAAGEIYVKSGDGRFYWRTAGDAQLYHQGTGATATSDPAGTIWVSGSTFYYVAGNGYRYGITGSTVASGLTPGSIWIDGTYGYFYYVNSSGVSVRRSGSI